MGVDGLRVAVDATPLLGTRTGIGTFTAAVLHGLTEHPDVTALPFSVARARGQGHAIRVPASLAHRWWVRWYGPRLDRLLGRPDVVHATNFVAPPTMAPAVVTVHDLTTLRFPELCHPATLRFPALVERAAAAGAIIHTVSEAVRSEVIGHLGVPAERVVAIPNGFTPVVGDAARGRALAGTDRYVLAVGTVEPRKDLPTLVRALDLAAERCPDLVVVHAGPDGWGTDELDRALAATSRRDRFRRLGPRTAAELADLYRGATALAYPSRYEGFGLPVLEAMSAGTPVVTTAVDAVTEVAGGAAAVVPIADADALAEALARAWHDPTWRAEATAAGLARATAFSWERCVDGLVGLYRRAAGGAGADPGPEPSDP